MPMSLNKAIEIITIWQAAGGLIADSDINAASNLLIEAGKRIQLYRRDYFSLPHYLLPGETEGGVNEHS